MLGIQLEYKSRHFVKEKEKGYQNAKCKQPTPIA